jgi:6-pyruvoyltetrahydropterin/6-carboxytetrahydropterin synthase
VEVEAAGEKLDKSGMLLDFSLLKAKLHKILGNLDHKYLNNIAYFKKINPTSENIAKYIYDGIRAKKLRIKAVTVWESDNSCATYAE